MDSTKNFMQPIFSRNANVNKIAFLNWRIEPENYILNMMNMADGYLMAAISLAENCLRNNSRKQADILIFPMLANANHGIELYLKAVNWIFNILLGSDKRIEGGHNIKSILQTTRSKVKLFNGRLTLSGFDEQTAELKSYIDELFEKIESTQQKDKMDFSRYPLDVKYNEHFYVNAVGNVEIDLENFVSRFTIIKNNLDEMASFMYFQELDQEC